MGPFNYNDNKLFTTEKGQSEVSLSNNVLNAALPTDLKVTWNFFHKKTSD